MWSRCWWATWLSGFFGIAGVLHLARAFVGIRLTLGEIEVPLALSAGLGAGFLGLSVGLLVIEAQRERAKRSGP